MFRKISRILKEGCKDEEKSGCRDVALGNDNAQKIQLENAYNRPTSGQVKPIIVSVKNDKIEIKKHSAEGKERNLTEKLKIITEQD